METVEFDCTNINKPIITINKEINFELDFVTICILNKTYPFSYTIDLHDKLHLYTYAIIINAYFLIYKNNPVIVHFFEREIK